MRLVGCRCFAGRERKAPRAKLPSHGDVRNLAAAPLAGVVVAGCFRLHTLAPKMAVGGSGQRTPILGGRRQCYNGKQVDFALKPSPKPVLPIF
jgi:hypothetical protein